MTGRSTHRSAMRRTVMIRRSAMVVGEVRIYQELIRLAVERNRLLAERGMWGQRSDEVSQKLAAAEKYTAELQQRIGLSRKEPSGASGAAARSTPQSKPSGGGVRGVRELRYAGSGSGAAPSGKGLPG